MVQGPWAPQQNVAKRPNKRSDVVVAIALPWLIFFLVICLFLFALHDLEPLVWVLITLCAALSVVFLVLGVSTRRKSFVVIGVMSILSTVMAAYCGVWITEAYLDRYWEIDGAAVHENVDPNTGFGSTKDVGVLRFAIDTFVDDMRTVGYVAKGNVFCVAPVNKKEAFTKNVQFWAVGSNCCGMRTNFDCGSARDLGETSSAIISNADKEYQDAAKQAEAVYGLTSSNNTLFVEFVQNTEDFLDDLWDQALTFALGASVADLLVCGAAGLALAKALSVPSGMRTQ